MRGRGKGLPASAATTGLQKRSCVMGEVCDLSWAVITKVQQTGGLNKHLFLAVLEAGKSKVEAAAD